MERIFHLHKSDLCAHVGKMPKFRYKEPPKGLKKKRKAKRRAQNQARNK